MHLPFTNAQFFDLFGAYNSTLWPAALVLWVLTLAAVVQIMRGRAGAVGLGALAALHWAWSGVVYHAAYFTAINPAAWIFAALFGAEALAWLWLGPIRRRLAFDWGASPRHVLAAVFLVYALIYPALGPITGHALPRTPLFAVPCPTAIFTAGVLLALVRPAPRWLFVVPIVWSVIGGSAAVTLGVAPDFMLLAAGAVLLVDVAVPRALGGSRPAAAGPIAHGGPGGPAPGHGCA
jgi:Family of unknown function (DUF6064)